MSVREEIFTSCQSLVPSPSSRVPRPASLVPRPASRVAGRGSLVPSPVRPDDHRPCRWTGTRHEGPGRGTRDEEPGTKDPGRRTRDEGPGTKDPGRRTRDEGLNYSARNAVSG